MSRQPFRPYSKCSRQMRLHPWFPCPGFIGDPAPRWRKFERWHERPQKSWLVYWRARPALYKEMLGRALNVRALPPDTPDTSRSVPAASE